MLSRGRPTRSPACRTNPSTLLLATLYGRTTSAAVVPPTYSAPTRPIDHPQPVPAPSHQPREAQLEKCWLDNDRSNDPTADANPPSGLIPAETAANPTGHGSRCEDLALKSVLYLLAGGTAPPI